MTQVPMKDLVCALYLTTPHGNYVCVNAMYCVRIKWWYSGKAELCTMKLYVFTDDCGWRLVSYCIYYDWIKWYMKTALGLITLIYS